VQDRCTVYDECTMDMEIALGTLDGTPKMYVKWNLVSVHLEIVLVSAQDRCTGCAERTIGLEIILDAPNGTRRRCGSNRCSFRSVWR
jgi:hypothetical protein